MRWGCERLSGLVSPQRRRDRKESAKCEVRCGPNCCLEIKISKVFEALDIFKPQTRVKGRTV